MVVGQGVRADNKLALAWQKDGIVLSIWTLSNTGAFEGSAVYGPYDGWNLRLGDLDSNSKLHFPWEGTSGQFSLWTLDSSLGFESAVNYGPY
jgi:hypothetical protein